jgi:hypothetical protein
VSATDGLLIAAQHWPRSLRRTLGYREACRSEDHTRNPKWSVAAFEGRQHERTEHSGAVHSDLSRRVADRAARRARWRSNESTARPRGDVGNFAERGTGAKELYAQACRLNSPIIFLR